MDGYSALVDVEDNVLGCACACDDVVLAPDPLELCVDVGAFIELVWQLACVVDAFNAHKHPLRLEDLSVRAAPSKKEHAVPAPETLSR
jgi:hypothetical protein